MQDLAHTFLLSLAITHDAFSHINELGVKTYQGSSPDQLSFVEAAKAIGYEFLNSTSEEVRVAFQEDVYKFKLLNRFSFDSNRKRMSVVIRFGGHIVMFIKGADNIILEKLANDNQLNLDSEINKLSSEGLRVMLFAMRIISEEEYNIFQRKHKKLIE